MGCPLDIQNVAMTGADKTITIQQEWKAVILKMKETDVAFTVKSTNPNYSGAEATIAAGEKLAFESDNFKEAETLYVNAASGTLEIIASRRENC